MINNFFTEHNIPTCNLFRQNFEPAKKRVLCQCLRYVSHAHGASLIFYSMNDSVLVKRSKEMISHYGFGTPHPWVVGFRWTSLECRWCLWCMCLFVIPERILYTIQTNRYSCPPDTIVLIKLTTWMKRAALGRWTSTKMFSFPNSNRLMNTKFTYNVAISDLVNIPWRCWCCECKQYGLFLCLRKKKNK